MSRFLGQTGLSACPSYYTVVNEMSVTEIHQPSPSLPPGTPMSKRKVIVHNESYVHIHVFCFLEGPPSTASITSPSSLEPDSPYHLPSQSNSGNMV